MTGGPLLWHPSSASVLRNSSETTSAMCCLPHWICCNLHIAATIPQTMLLPSPCILLSPTWKTRTPMWGCCLWTTAIVFNTIQYQLFAKLQTLGLNRSLCSWILDFLTGRSQVVRMGNNTSSPLTLNTGAPQGCVLSPLLYSLYTHDCAATHSSNVIVKFADDTTVIGLITDNDETAYRAEVSTLTKWCQENHISLNIDKTKELVVDFRRQSREHTPITIDKTPVERVNSFKFLGVHITEDLTWSAHTECWRSHINASSSWDGWGSLEWAPASSDHSTPALWRASWPAASPPGLETAPLATAKLCKGLCELPATLLEVSFPPSRISTPGGV